MTDDPRLQGLWQDADATCWNADGMEVVQLPHGDVALVHPAKWCDAPEEDRTATRFLAILEAVAAQHTIDHALRLADFAWRQVSPHARTSARELEEWMAPLARQWIKMGHEFKNPAIAILAQSVDKRTMAS